MKFYMQLKEQGGHIVLKAIEALPEKWNSSRVFTCPVDISNVQAG